MTNLQKVQENGYTIQHIKTQTHELCLAAVKETGYAID